MAHVQSPGSKILRVALIQGAKITEDRPIRKRINVTVGQDPKNTFVVPVSNLPPGFTLFEIQNDQYSLLFTEQMDGKVKVGDGDLSFAALRDQGLAKKRGNVYALALNDSMRGKVTLGEVSLLFQFVTPPPEPPKAELPPNIRGGFWKGLDQLFFTILAVSLTVHFSGATFIACQPLPPERELSLDELPDRFVKQMMPEPPKPEKKEEKKAEVAEKKEEKKVEKKEEPKTAEQKHAEIAKKVESKGLLKILGSAGGAGALEDVLGGSTGGADIKDALAGASGVVVATGDGVNGPKGGGAGTAAGIGDLGTSGGGNVNLAKNDAAIRGRVSEGSVETESGEVDRNALAKFVKSRLPAIQGCYERELKRNPSLKGKVVVRFTIGTNGRVTEIDIEENSLGNQDVGGCIKNLIRAWVFPFKPESEATVSYPFVFAPAS